MTRPGLTPEANDSLNQILADDATHVLQRAEPLSLEPSPRPVPKRVCRPVDAVMAVSRLAGVLKDLTEEDRAAVMFAPDQRATERDRRRRALLLRAQPGGAGRRRPRQGAGVPGGQRGAQVIAAEPVFTVRDAARGLAAVVVALAIALGVVTMLSAQSCGDDEAEVAPVLN